MSATRRWGGPAALRWAYSPIRSDLSAPGDRRRFGFWAAARGVPFRLARPGSDDDVVVLSARADITHWSRTRRGPQKLVYDIVDSYLDVPTTGLVSRLRGTAKFLSRETSRPVADYRAAIARMCARADVVICASEEQRRTILEYNDNVHAVLDSSSELGGEPKTDYGARGTVRLVWEGLPENIRHFATIADVLRDICRVQPIEVHLVTAPDYGRYLGRYRRQVTSVEARRILGDMVVLHDWDVQTLPLVAKRCDLAVIPLDLHDPLARGKPENKLVGFWRLAVPAVVSATPSYERTMAAAGQPELACRTEHDWAVALRRLISDQTTRETAARRGSAYVECHQRDDQLLTRWDAAFRSIL